MGKHKLRRLGRKVFRYDAKLDKVVELTVINTVKPAPSVIIFKEEWYEHIDEHPIFITSKKQLRRECEQRGMIAKALD